MKKILLRGCAGLLAFLLTAALFLWFHQVFNYKYYDGPSQVAAFYQQPENTVDVLNMGSSRIFMNVNPAVLWETYGIASFDLCAGAQPLWNTYYFLEEALKTQSPRVIVLDTYFACLAEEYSNEVPRDIKSLFPLKLSLTKLRALQASIPTERLGPMGMEFFQYHGRYQELDRNDFTNTQVEYLFAPDNPDILSSWKGYVCNFALTPFEKRTDKVAKTECVELYPKVEEYLRKIIELAQSKNIDVLLVQAPFPDNQHDYPEIMNSVARLAAEYGVPFVDFDASCRDQMDYSTDFADNFHLSPSGAARYSGILGGYLKEHYDLPDRRGEAGYESWDTFAVCYHSRISDQQLHSAWTDLTGYLELLAALPENYEILFSLDGTYADGSVDFATILTPFGISCEGSDAGKWIVHPDGEVSAADEGGVNYPLTIADEDLEIVADAVGIYRDGQPYVKADNGLTVIVYDPNNHSVADAVRFDASTGFAMVR